MLKKFTSFTPTLGESWKMFVCVVIFGSILALPTSLLKDVHVISTFLAYILTLSPAFLYAFLKAKRGDYSPKYKINDPYFGKLGPLPLFLLLPLIYAAFTIVTDPIGTMLEAPEWFSNVMRDTAVGGNMFWSAITTCICAPLLEELLCRGLMLRGMIENGMKPAKAILWSALIFGILHMNPWQAIPAFILGSLFGWLYYKTRCIWVPIILHILNNSTSTILYEIFPEMTSNTSFKDMVGDPQLYFSIFAVSIAVLALTYFIISKFVGKRDEYEKETVISD